MFFYFKPPRGFISSDMLQKCAVSRLKFFRSGENSYSDFEFIIFGSAFDRAGHFLLRLFVAIQSKEDLKHLLIEWETELFLERLTDIKLEEKLKAFKVLHRHVREMKKSNVLMLQEEELFQALVILSQSLSTRSVCAHVFNSSECGDQCSSYSVHVRFKTCPYLVKTRQVVLSKGVASVPCCKWRTLLRELFLFHMDYGIRELIELKTVEIARLDVRLMAIFRSINAILGIGHDLRSNVQAGSSFSVLESKDVAKESVLFPPCMYHLHETLRKKHRLSHQARFHYSLFLKDIGMPLSESLAYWEAEYSKPHCPGSSCTHSWQKNSNKYVYGIKHLYGVTGGRKCYTTPDCHKMQCQSLMSRSDEGCPFLHFDDENLERSLLPNLCFSSKSEIYQKRKMHPLAACRFYLASKLPPSVNVDNMVTPIQFYNVLKKQRTKSWKRSTEE